MSWTLPGGGVERNLERLSGLGTGALSLLPAFHWPEPGSWPSSLSVCWENVPSWEILRSHRTKGEDAGRGGDVGARKPSATNSAGGIGRSGRWSLSRPLRWLVRGRLPEWPVVTPGPEEEEGPCGESGRSILGGGNGTHRHAEVDMNCVLGTDRKQVGQTRDLLPITLSPRPRLLLATGLPHSGQCGTRPPWPPGTSATPAARATLDSDSCLSARAPSTAGPWTAPRLLPGTRFLLLWPKAAHPEGKLRALP